MLVNRLIKINFLIILSSLLLFSGCDSLKGPELTISADREEIPAGGYEYAELTIILKKGGSRYADMEVSFEASNGSFSNSEEQLDTTATTDVEGKASVKLYSAKEQGASTVTATFEDPETGEIVSANISITFGPPSAASLPIAGNFNLDCDYSNVGALISSSKPDVQVPCQVTARNINGASIPTESLTLYFAAEAGELVGEYDEYSEEYVVKYKVRGGDPLPKDVDALSGEPERACGGLTCNPRDGLVTMVVVTAGAESFEDRNGNGEWDDGEPFEDLPEPFLDKNDNGVWDTDEWFFDTDGNGEYSDADGIYNADTMISAMYKILWTGKPEENETAAWISYSPQNTHLPNNGSMTVTVRLVDKNLNPVAGFTENGDMLNFIDSQGGLTPTQPASSPGSFAVDNIVGMSFDSEWRFLSCDETAADYSVNFVDSDPSGDASMSFIIGIDANLSPGPEGGTDEYNSYNFSFNTQISGTID